MPQFKVLVIGDPETLSETTRFAWQSADVTLEGPVAPHTIDLANVRDWAGALVDISVLDESLMDLLDSFDRLKLPYIFVIVGTSVPTDGPQPYVLGPEPADIRTLMQALLSDDRKGPGGTAPRPHS